MARRVTSDEHQLLGAESLPLRTAEWGPELADSEYGAGGVASKCDSAVGALATTDACRQVGSL